MLYKPYGILNVPKTNEKDALSAIIKGLKENDTAFIYRCWKHFFMICGYEIVPKKREQAYCKLSDIGESETWLLMCDTLETEDPIISRRWSDIVKDITIRGNKIIDIRHLERGEQECNDPASLVNDGILILKSGIA